MFGWKTTEVQCHFRHLMSRVLTFALTYTIGVDLDRLAEAVFVRALHGGLLFYSLFHLELIGRGH